MRGRERERERERERDAWGDSSGEGEGERERARAVVGVKAMKDGGGERRGRDGDFEHHDIKNELGEERL